MDFFSVLETDGKQNLEADVSGYADDTTVRQLAENIRTRLVIPMKIQKNQNTNRVYILSAVWIWEFDWEYYKSIYYRLFEICNIRLYKYCLERDGFNYTVIGVWSRIYSYPAGTPTGNLETVYIISFVLETFESSSGPAVVWYSEIWTIIRYYFPIVYTIPFSSNQINDEWNIFILYTPLYTVFGGFCI